MNIDKVQFILIEQNLNAILFCRRRHSYHIKMTQYTKNLTPGLGQRNKENHNHFSAMEKKLKEMQESLALIDRELEEEEALKQVSKALLFWELPVRSPLVRLFCFFFSGKISSFSATKG